MKINLNILSAGLLLATAVSFSSCDDFLTRDPQDTVTDVPSFWNNEENLRTSFLDYYTYFFPGYRSSWERADNFAETNVADWTDDNAQEEATLFTKVAPTTDADNWNFEKIRKDGYLYIDKTALIYQLVKTGSYYFLSRPRRFGKSLLLSTLEAYFQGKKELFEGLAMEKLEKDWIRYPILHLDLNAERYSDPGALESILRRYLNLWEDLWGKDEREITPSDRFTGVIRRAYERTGRRVVILVDEYDKPLLQAIGNPELQEAYRSILKAFYGVLKSMDGYIRLAFLTGVTKFGKVSVFSDLNNLMDLSMDNRYVEICGITEKEIHAYLDDEVKELADTQMTTYEETCLKLKQRYDGYHFTAKSEGIYNPFSLLNTFAKMEFGDYWFETGTPSYLVELLKHTHYDLYEMANTETDADRLRLEQSHTRHLPKRVSDHQGL